MSLAHTFIIEHSYLETMTCYFRHMSQIFEEIGIEVTQENRREIDHKIHGMLGVDYKNCPETWKMIKQKMATDEAGFKAALKRALTI